MSKKLLSVLVVLALALSLIPVVGLPAAEAEAATVNYKQNLVDTNTTDDKMTADCPACGAKNVEWTKLTKSFSNTEGHYYLAEDLDATVGNFYANLISADTNKTVCFHLNGKKLTTHSRMMSRGGSTVNIIAGNGGKVTYTGGSADASAFLYPNGGAGSVVNVYGGTYDYVPSLTGTGKVIAKPNGELNLYDAKLTGGLLGFGSLAGSVTTLYGTTSVDVADYSGTGKLIIAEGWSGSVGAYKPFPGSATSDPALDASTGLFLKKRIEALGNFTGTIKTADGEVMSYTEDGLMLTKAAIGSVAYGSAEAALAAYTAQDFTDGKVLKLYADATLALTGADYYIDACGNDITVSGTGKLYPMDSANDGYDKAKCGEWTISGVTVVNDVTNGKRYITIKEGSKYSAHRLGLDITDAALRTSENGLFFKAEIKADATLAARIKAYGVTTSKTDAPTAVVENDNAFTKLTDFTPNSKHVVYTNSALVKGIFKDAADANNKTRSETKIYAAAYVSVQLDNAAETTTDLFSEGVSSSAADVLKAIDTKWSSYNAKAQANAKSFFAQWKGKGASGNRIEDLGLTNIK